MRQPPRPPAGTPSPPRPPDPAPRGAPRPRPSKVGLPSVQGQADDKPITLNISLSETSTDLEKAEAIRDVMQHAVTMSQAVALAKEMKSWPLRPITLAVVAIASLTLTAYTFLAEADWAYGPDPAAVAPARHDAHLKFALFLTAQGLEAYREANGSLPPSLAEAGEDWPSVVYQPMDSTFELRARGAAGESIVLESNADMKKFLGDSRRQLREHRP